LGANDRNGDLKEWNAIRLTDERWAHFTEEHSELAGMRFEVLEVVADPLRVYAGSDGELLAVRDSNQASFFVYRELASDGFIITAFLTRRVNSLERRSLLWPLPN